MNAPHQDHPSEDALERFLLSHCPEEELEIIESHVLACETCVTRLESLEIQIAATKLALKTLHAAEAAKRSAARDGGWRGWFTIPHLAWAAGAAACALGLFVISMPRNVEVTAYRGAEATTVTEWRPLMMHLNATDLPPGPVDVEIVDAQGSGIWQGRATIQNDKVDVRVPRLTHAGYYFLRLKSPAATKTESQLLREFSLNASFSFNTAF